MLAHIDGAWFHIRLAMEEGVYPLSITFPKSGPLVAPTLPARWQFEQ